MDWRRRFYERSYRRGAAPWDTGITPPEVVEVVEGTRALAPGRALDLGCGTGTNLLYLIHHGWEAVGVDFSEEAVRRALERTAGTPGVHVVRGDVTRLSRIGVRGPFDLVLDIGCFHGVPRGRRDAYAGEVAGVTRSGSTYLVFAFGARGTWRVLRLGSRRQEMERRFGEAFELVEIVPGREPPGAAWYRFLRR